MVRISSMDRNLYKGSRKLVSGREEASKLTFFDIVAFYDSDEQMMIYENNFDFVARDRDANRP